LKTGAAVPKDHELGEKRKRGRTKFFLQERSLPFDYLIGDPLINNPTTQA
jgi:hypothetical protein